MFVIFFSIETCFYNLELINLHNCIYCILLCIRYLRNAIFLSFWNIDLNLSVLVYYFSVFVSFCKILRFDPSLWQFLLIIKPSGPCWDRFQRHESNEGQKSEPVRFWFMWVTEFFQLVLFCVSLPVNTAYLTSLCLLLMKFSHRYATNFYLGKTGS